MAVAFVNTGTRAVHTGEVSSMAPSYPASISAGNLLLLCVHGSAAGTLSAVTIPMGWAGLFISDDEYLNLGTSPRLRQDILYRWADGTETGTVTVNFPNNRRGVASITQFSGVAMEHDGTPAIELGGVHKGASTPDPVSIVTTGNDRLGIIYNIYQDQRFSSGSFGGATTRYDQGTSNGNPRGSLGTSDIATPSTVTYGDGNVNQRHVTRTFALSPVALLTPPGAGQRAFGTIIA